MSRLNGLTNEQLKKNLWEELIVKTDLIANGVDISKDALKYIKLGTEIQEQVHCLFEMDFKLHDFDLPAAFDLPHGLSVPFNWNPESAYKIEYEKGNFVLTKKGNKVYDVKFHSRPNFYSKKTTDGKNMANIGVYNPDGHVFVVYSNECSYKDKGEDCLFCNINHTKDTYAEKEGTEWKTPVQIGQVVAQAYKEGTAKHVTITGGVIAERRELDYYLDVADEISKQTGLKDFNGTATVAAPLDLTNIDRLKEAGYRTTSMNLEIWDKNIYKTICPGKAGGSGGWDHWLESLEYAVKVFGYGRVRSTFVAGIEPKKNTLEGLEYLASKGIIGIASLWIPNIGSALEGHRTPEPAWHLDLAEKNVNAWKKNGITYEQVYDANAGSDSLQHDIYRIQDELFPVFKNK